MTPFRHLLRNRKQRVLSAIFLGVIGLSLLFMVVLTSRFVNQNQVYRSELLQYRNELIREELIGRMKQIEDVVATVPPGSPREILDHLHNSPLHATWEEWMVIDSTSGQLLRRGHSEPIVASSGYGVRSYTRRQRNVVQFVRIIDDKTGHEYLGIVHSLPEPLPGAPGTHGLSTLLVSHITLANIAASALNPVGITGTTATLVDDFGMVMLEQDPDTWSATAGLSSPAANSVRIVPPQDVHQYLGFFNRYLPTTSDGTPLFVMKNGVAHSWIPLTPFPGSVVLEETLRRDTTATGRVGLQIGGSVLLIYSLIVYLFFALRRTIVEQGSTISRLSSQKDTMFSLLSHDLKNDLAALTATARTGKNQEHLMKLLDDTGRVVGDALYAMRFVEERFPPVSRESIPVGDILELLSLRLGSDHSGVTIPEEADQTAAPVYTNLNLVLDALERLVIVIEEAVPPGPHRISVKRSPPGGIIITCPAVGNTDIPAAFETTFSIPDSSNNPRQFRLAVARGLLTVLDITVTVTLVTPDTAALHLQFPLS